MNNDLRPQALKLAAFSLSTIIHKKHITSPRASKLVAYLFRRKKLSRQGARTGKQGDNFVINDNEVEQPIEVVAKIVRDHSATKQYADNTVGMNHTDGEQPRDVIAKIVYTLACL